MTPDPLSDEALKTRLRQWTIDPLGDAAQDRLIAAAMARPQTRSWLAIVSSELEVCLTDWRYGLPYKAAAVAFCLVAGVGAGMATELPDNIGSIAFMVNVGSAS